MQQLTDLDRLERCLDDVEIVLECLSRERIDACSSCLSARADATIAQRPALAACSEHKLPLEVPLALV